MRYFKIFSIFAVLALSLTLQSNAQLRAPDVKNLRIRTTADYTIPGEKDSLYLTVLNKNQRNLYKISVQDLLGYKEWTGLLTQASTGAPTATVLKNSLGGTIVWARTSAGLYTATLTGAFTDATKVSIQGNAQSDGTAVPIILAAVRTSANVITLKVSQAGVLADDKLVATSFTIKVYK